MKLRSFKIALKSLLFHRKESVYQIAILSVLSAIICGSLLTGFSVRSSLRKNLEEKRGSADYLISSGLRYFNSSLAGKFTLKSGLRSAAIIETEGYCSNFSNGRTTLNVKMYGTDPDFFTFHNHPSVVIPKGHALVNEYLARKLDLKPGDEVVMGYNGINPLPSNAPFAPEEGVSRSAVFRVNGIISGNDGGNFSLGSNQSYQPGIFVNINELGGSTNNSASANRLLIKADKETDQSLILKYFREVLDPMDIGLSVRKSLRTGEPELISDRIFIDSAIVHEITGIFPSSIPLITYLGNSFEVKSKSTPYSFITALPTSVLPDLQKNEMIIGRWLADDLDARPGDSLRLTWFDPGSGKTLKEKEASFIIHSVAEDDFTYSDPSLMPEFPGISGSTTCSSWDAGVPLNLRTIRKKDEDYWASWKGTPKAFINYESGLKLWGNNFGPATAIRFDRSADCSMIVRQLSGNINPLIAGFSMTDLRTRNSEASSKGVDFGMLFLGLSFFIIISCVILLSLSLRLFLDSRRSEIWTYHSIGFRNMKITRIVFYEALVVSSVGAVTGAFLGYLVNILIINALNSVWTGAVQTDTLSPGFSLLPGFWAFAATIIISSVIVILRLRYFLAELARGSKTIFKTADFGKSRIYLYISLLTSVILLILSIVIRNSSTILAFAGGTFLFVAMISAAYHFFAGRRERSNDYSGLYYSYYPLKAVTPVIFLAAGIFAVIITGANRQVVSEKMALPGGGTGGFLLWAESALPVNRDLSSKAGRAEFGFDEDGLEKMTFVEAKKLSGDDASCLNITHVTAPPLLGIDPVAFIEKGSFSFATSLKMIRNSNPWSLLNESSSDNIIYGIADQTVLEWGLKMKTGDTLKYVSENGQVLNIIICAGLKSSLFQGYLLIGNKSFEKHFPSVAGNSVFLIDGKREESDLYKNTITERLSGYGMSVEPALERLSSFFEVTNTYLNVFMVMGIFGMILGVAGLGFILIRNFNSRKREFALMIASGFTVRRIRRLLLKDHFLILIWGLLTGAFSAICTTWPSLAGGADLPWGIFITMLLLVFLTGYLVLSASVRVVNRKDVIIFLKGE